MEDSSLSRSLYDTSSRTYPTSKKSPNPNSNSVIELGNSDLYLNIVGNGDVSVHPGGIIQGGGNKIVSSADENSLAGSFLGDIANTLKSSVDVAQLNFSGLNATPSFSSEFNSAYAASGAGGAADIASSKLVSQHLGNLLGERSTAVSECTESNHDSHDMMLQCTTHSSGEVSNPKRAVSNISLLDSEDNNDPSGGGDTLDMKKRRARPRKLPGAPKRARAPYIFFQQAKREEVKNSIGPDAKGTDVLQKCAAMWRALDEKSKEPYVLRAQEDKARYDKEIKAFRSNYNASLNSVKMFLSRNNEPPRRGASAFLQYSKANRDRMKREHPDAPNKELSKLLGTEWHQLSEEQKAPYQDLALKDAARYREEMAEYSAQGGRSNIESAVAESMQNRNIPTGYPGPFGKPVPAVPDPAAFANPYGRLPFAGMTPPYGMPCGADGRAYIGGFPYPGFGFMPGFGPFPGFYGMNPAAFAGRGFGMPGRPPMQASTPFSLPSFDPNITKADTPSPPVMNSVLQSKPAVPTDTSSM